MTRNADEEVEVGLGKESIHMRSPDTEQANGFAAGDERSHHHRFQIIIFFGCARHIYHARVAGWVIDQFGNSCLSNTSCYTLPKCDRLRFDLFGICAKRNRDMELISFAQVNCNVTDVQNVLGVGGDSFENRLKVA